MRRPLFAILAFALVLAATPFVASRGVLLTVTEASAVLAIAVAWNLLASFGGIVLIGLPLFIGVGSYTLYLVANGIGVAPHLVVPAAGLVAAAIAFALAPLLFRLSGAQLAIGSWVMAEVGRILVLQSDALGAGGGINLEAIRLVPRSMRLELNYAASVVVALLAITGIVLLMRSRWGLALRALKDSEAASAAVGIKVGGVRILVLGLCAFISGLAAAVYYIGVLQVTPGSAFGISWMAVVVFVVVLGGIGSLEGPILGTKAYFTLREAFADKGELYFVLLGALAIAVTILAPRGLWGLLRSRIGFDLLPVTHLANRPRRET